MFVSMSYTLIIVDMQARFSAATKKIVQRNCQVEIRKAIKNNIPIVFLEFEDCGPTLRSLTDIVANANYSYAYKAVKPINDGSEHVLSLLRKKKLPRTDFRVCGVNTDCCVLSTVEGLDSKIAKKLKIEVVSKACGSQYCHEEGIYDLISIGNRVVVL
jgi:nicotinamidase-related amidase